MDDVDERPSRPTSLRPAFARPVFARHAASLLLVRHRDAGPEVLMGVRAGGHRFLPNRLVFPGGAVDVADRTAAAASEPTPELLAALRQTVGPRLARAIVMAAARELQEESGLHFGDPPYLDRMHYLCRAITPPRSPIRFNARFLVADAAATQGEPADSAELLDVRFVPLADTGALDLMAVTRWALQVLSERLATPADAEPALALPPNRLQPGRLETGRLETGRVQTGRLQVFRGERPRAERRR